MSVTKRELLAGSCVAGAALAIGVTIAPAVAADPFKFMCGAAGEGCVAIVSDTMAVIHLDDGVNIPMAIPGPSGSGYTSVASAYADAASDLDLDYAGQIESISVSRDTYKLMRRNNLIDYVPGDNDRHFPVFMGHRLYVPGTKLARA